MLHFLSARYESVRYASAQTTVCIMLHVAPCHDIHRHVMHRQTQRKWAANVYVPASTQLQARATTSVTSSRFQATLSPRLAAACDMIRLPGLSPFRDSFGCDCHLPAGRTRTDRPTTRRARLCPCVLRPCHDACAILLARCPAAGPGRPCTPLRPYAAAIRLPKSCFPTLPFHYGTVSPTVCEPPCSLAARFSNIRLCSASVSFALPPYLTDIAHRASDDPFTGYIRRDTNSGSPLDIIDRGAV